MIDVKGPIPLYNARAMASEMVWLCRVAMGAWSPWRTAYRWWMLLDRDAGLLRTSPSRCRRWAPLLLSLRWRSRSPRL